MDLSIIIVSFNAKEVLERCLNAVFEFAKDLKFEVIVVDNASTDGAVEVLKGFEERVTNLKVIYSQENLGFAKANNLAMRQAKGKYFLLLNNDAILIENSPKMMIDWINAHPEFAAASCELLDSEQKKCSIISAGYFPRFSSLFAWAVFLDDLPGVSKLFKPYHVHTNMSTMSGLIVDWISGSFFFLKREVWEKTGGFDENIFMYGEDLDWCYRIVQIGYKIGYTDSTKVIHVGQASQGKLPRGYVLGEFAGLRYFYAKHFPGWKQWAAETILDIAAFLRIIFWLVRLKPPMAKVYLEALLQ